MKDSLKFFTEHFYNGENATVNIGLVSYSDQASIVQQMTSQTETVLSAIDGLSQSESTDTKIDSGLTTGCDFVLPSGRFDATKIIVLVASKESSSILTETIETINSKGISLFSFGFTSEISDTYLSALTTDPDHRKAYNNVHELMNMPMNFADKICNIKPSVSAMCTGVIVDMVILVPSNISEYIDIFVENYLDLADNKIRVNFVQFGQNVIDDSGFLTSRASVQQAITGIKNNEQIEDFDIAAGLNYILANVVDGRRAHVRTVVSILTNEQGNTAGVDTILQNYAAEEFPVVAYGFGDAADPEFLHTVYGLIFRFFRHIIQKV